MAKNLYCNLVIIAPSVRWLESVHLVKTNVCATDEIDMNQLHQIKKYFQIRFDNVQKAFSNINRITLFSDSEKRFFAVALLVLGVSWHTTNTHHERIIVVPQILVITTNDDFRVEPYQVFETTRPHKHRHRHIPRHKPKYQGRPEPSDYISVACSGWRTVDPLRVHSGWGMCCPRSGSRWVPQTSSVPSGTPTVFEVRGFDDGS